MSNFFNLLYKYFKIRSFFYFEECLKKTAKPATERVNGMENEERMQSGNKKEGTAPNPKISIKRYCPECSRMHSMP